MNFASIKNDYIKNSARVIPFDQYFKILLWSFDNKLSTIFESEFLNT